ncbi:MAG: CDP-diacylglycerol--glycerol-3-phosphate 3-phosphatidyltransferase [Spirochaetaceae bacterium]|nr:CDP-diacylglycerol--glycerol-3-phosphate 3-phosphatidyltransferase [Spirochaetaceae bacterium]
MRIADKLTLVRICYAPVFLVFYLLANSESPAFVWFSTHSFIILLILTILLALVEFTDYLDGNIARKLKQVSDTGKLLDPFADALLHITTFFCFTYSRYMPPILFMIIFYREFGMIFLRMQTIKNGVAIAARPGGKLKTVFYIVAGFWTLAVNIYEKSGGWSIPCSDYFPVIAIILFSICALLALISFIDYIVHFAIGIKK